MNWVFIDLLYLNFLQIMSITNTFEYYINTTKFQFSQQNMIDLVEKSCQLKQFDFLYLGATVMIALS